MFQHMGRGAGAGKIALDDVIELDAGERGAALVRLVRRRYGFPMFAVG